MGKSSAPAPPDYSGIAKEQSALDREAMRESTYVNRPDQYTPFGSVTFTPGAKRDPVTGKIHTTFRQDTQLRPDLTHSLSSQLRLGSQRAGLAEGIMGRVLDPTTGYGSPMDYSRFRSVTEVGDPNAVRGRAEDAMYDRATSRLDPRFDEAEEKLMVRLRNQGLRAGDQAYDSEIANFERGRNDAYERAHLGSVAEGRQESSQLFRQMQQQQAQSASLRNQQIAEEMQRRGMPLQEINALLAGQGIQPGTVAPPGFGAEGSTGGPNLMGAAQNTYRAQQDAFNARQAQRQGMMSGVTGLAGAAATYFSDPSLKSNVKWVGTWGATPYPAYTYTYKGSNKVRVGVMANEVNQDAVIPTEFGVDSVDYARIA